jgi:hypothetical protein
MSSTDAIPFGRAQNRRVCLLSHTIRVRGFQRVGSTLNQSVNLHDYSSASKKCNSNRSPAMGTRFGERARDRWNDAGLEAQRWVGPMTATISAPPSPLRGLERQVVAATLPRQRLRGRQGECRTQMTEALHRADQQNRDHWGYEIQKTRMLLGWVFAVFSDAEKAVCVLAPPCRFPRSWRHLGHC